MRKLIFATVLSFVGLTAIAQEETAELPTLDLADIRSDYEPELEEGGDCYHCKGDDPDCEHCNGSGYVQFDDDPQEPSQEVSSPAAQEDLPPILPPKTNQGAQSPPVKSTDLLKRGAEDFEFYKANRDSIRKAWKSR